MVIPSRPLSPRTLPKDVLHFELLGRLFGDTVRIHPLRLRPPLFPLLAHRLRRPPLGCLLGHQEVLPRPPGNNRHTRQTAVGAGEGGLVDGHRQLRTGEAARAGPLRLHPQQHVHQRGPHAEDELRREGGHQLVTNKYVAMAILFLSPSSYLDSEHPSLWVDGEQPGRVVQTVRCSSPYSFSLFH